MDYIMGWLALPIAAIVGFFLPGFYLARLLRSPESIVVSFCLSLLILFQGLFWFGVFGILLDFRSILVYLLIVTMLAWLASKRWSAPLETRAVAATQERSLLRLGTLLAVTLVVLVMVLRSTISPLSGPDTPFRWNHLSVQILKEGTFAFYPPRSAEDFKSYFFVDGIPPLVSFAYWWLYAALGRADPSVTGLLVTGQFLAAIAMCYFLGKQFHSPAAGYLAVLLLLTCPLFFWAVVIGQETGLTAISLATGLYLIQASVGNPTPSRMILAGLVIAVGALSREYGVAFLGCGVFAAWYLGIPWQHTTAFIIAGVLACAPWYVRNWVLTGNPFYSNPIDSLFSVNPVHVGILRTYSTELGFTPTSVFWLLVILLTAAPLILPLGIIGAFCLRGIAYLSFAIATVFVLWLYSVPQTAGGYYYSMRVLSPALLLLAVLGGVIWASGTLSPLLKRGCVVAAFLACGWAVLADLYVPSSIQEGLESRLLFTPPHNDRRYEQLAEELRPLKSRILSDNAYTYAGLVQHGIEVVPVWSPEVRFLFEGQESSEQMRKRLITLGIRLVEYTSPSLNNLYLDQSPFYSDDQRNWVWLLKWGGNVLYFLPDDRAVRP